MEMRVFDGGAQRTNLDFVVVKTSGPEKFAHVQQILEEDLPPSEPGGAIVYCSTRAQTEALASFLTGVGISAGHFHARRRPDTKKDVQARFIDGDLRVIVATNAFGMGIDKRDVRLVVHADIPGSLENYPQEADRAGRDQRLARCVLMYTGEDVERQFGMSAGSRLTRREIQAVLTALRRLDRKKNLGGEGSGHVRGGAAGRRGLRLRARFGHRRHPCPHVRVVAGGRRPARPGAELRAGVPVATEGTDAG